MISSAFSFTGCLEFVSESNISPLARLDVCPPRHYIYLFFLSLGVILRVPIALHFHVAYDDIIRQ